MTNATFNPLARNASGIVGKARLIKQWTRELLPVRDEAVVTVSELLCALPDCPPKETVILVMETGLTRQFSIHKGMDDVVMDDVALVLRLGAQTVQV